ncbi:MAG: HsdR family type I site-specific deoxyribonuclease, partial [Anaerolineae bacterium]|jgi:type I restriction enzyme R subunit|nr:HsdR family type I site-specific deoxyribonuclease [Anaerolineae bacterium]
LGWQYLTPAEALTLRENHRERALLTGVLEPWLEEHNAVDFKGQRVPFTAANLRKAVEAMLNEPYEGPIVTNQRLYERLTLGISLPQTVAGDTRSFNLHYVDWEHPERNVFHITEEFEIERRGSHQTRRPDLVGFVNGIPFVVIECKRPDLTTASGEKGVQQAVSQMLRNQKLDEIPELFITSHLLLALSENAALYATTGTERKFWAVWEEPGLDTSPDGELYRRANAPLSPEQQARLYDWRDHAAQVRAYFAAQDRAPRLVTPQDCALYALLRLERLLELTYRYLVYDAGVKKIARYQQYFAVKATLDRVAHLDPRGRRTGGVIWHTTGSGKSLTMVMLAKGLALHPNLRNSRIVIVTDRVDLDTQIWNTFRACGKQVKKAASGKELGTLLHEGKADIITTVIDKFDTSGAQAIRVQDSDIFVLVDESHRSQYGEAHVKMRRVLPDGCYIGFTGTPLLKAEKSTAAKFGGFIHTYSMRQAVEDQAVVPLLYEGRMAELSVDQAALDRWFERVTEGLSEEQRRDLKHKFSRAGEVSQAEQRVRQIAYDLSDHYRRNFQGQGFKAQLATSSKALALRYKRCLDEFGMVTSAVVISPPDTREGHEDIETTPELEAFWKQMLARYGSEKQYLQELIADFGRADGVEILIVVDKLLVGFDEPRNTVLYLDKPLKDHAILQAIARVNRLFEGKDFGYVLDYRGILGELNAAMQVYNALEGFDPDDIAGTITDVSAEIAQVPQLHAALWELFKTLPNKQDREAFQQFLAPEDVRQRFYDALSAYTRALKAALTAVSFYEQTSEARIATYKRDLVFFHNLRTAVRQRYAEAIDYHDYEARVRKLLDSHIHSAEVLTVVEAVNIFDSDAFAAQVARFDTAAGQADTITSHLKRAISEQLERDPAFYQKFSRLVEETIAAYRQGRLDEAEYLKKAQELQEDFQRGYDDGIPEALRQHRDAPAYYGTLSTILEPHLGTREAGPGYLAAAAIQTEEIVAQHKIRDWAANPDIQRQIKFALDEYLYDVFRVQGVDLSNEELEMLLENLVALARKRDMA